MHVWHFFAALLLFSGWNSVLKDPRKHCKREFDISCIEARVKRISLRLSYSPASTLRVICFTLRNASKFHATFSPHVFVLPCFALLKFSEEISSEYPGMYRAIRVTSGKTREEKILVNLPARFSYFVLSTFHLPMVTCAFFSVRLFRNTSQVWLCSCGLCPFILLNYCTVVHYKRGNKSKEGKIGSEPKITLWGFGKIFFRPLQDGDLER